jgi:nucleoside-diphosphate-sugar epimerase
MSAFILKLLRGERPTIFGTGEKRRDFVYVDDVNRFHVQCMTDARTDGRVFNLGSGRNHSVREIFEEIRVQLGSELEPRYAAGPAGRGAGDAGGHRRGPFAGVGAGGGAGGGVARSIRYIRDEVLGAPVRAAVA